MPSNHAYRIMNAVHRWVLRLSGQRLLTSFGHMPVLELTTIGCKSGKRRSVFLASPMQDGEVIYVVGSRTGTDVCPGWVFNVQANPNVEIAYRGGPRKPMVAHVAGPEERAQLWPRIISQPVGWTRKKNAYAGYQTRTTRELPVIVVEPC